MLVFFGYFSHWLPMLCAEESKRVRERDWELLNERCSFILLRWEWYGTVWKRKYLHTQKKAAVNTLDWSICPPPSLYLGNRAISQHRFISIGFYFLGFILKLHCFYFIFFCYFDSCILRVYLSFSLSLTLTCNIRPPVCLHVPFFLFHAFFILTNYHA